MQISESLWQYYRNEPALEKNGSIIDFLTDNNNTSFKFKQQIIEQAGNSVIKNVEIMVPIKYLSSFWRTLKMSLINCEISIQLKCSTESVLIAGTAPNQVPIFTKTDTKLYVPVVTLSTKDNVILLKQLESSFKKTMNWNNYQSKKTN